ncbi:MAG: glutaredoxin family protein [Spirochaetes bacterium]|jgi:glutaredoxin|nr:glutaredoxin family protein [Spirochaetota bacterium]MBP8986622.1 glutaredoxin family protein [Spirochaetota bacterium]HOE20846.1 glutaredoxin family protein [Spirochaetota bacterium]HQL43258.1 glutaredoxin family protein [Spirochaetota bacterium]HQQ50163.1 glutaredoxin family protein [Spirochaetota bacterium]
MIENINFTYKDGLLSPGDITVYALSTCGHCKRALKFLDDNSVKYKFVYVDLLSSEEKNNIKDYLAKKSNMYVAFPFLVIDDSTFFTGFIEEEWRRLLKME